MLQQIGAIPSTGETGRRLVWRPGNGIDNKANLDGDVKKTRIIRLSGIALIIASAGVMADAFRLTSVEIAIGTMFIALLAGSSGLALFLWQSVGKWAAGLGLLGVLLILGSQFLYPSEAFAWMFALALLALGYSLWTEAGSREMAPPEPTTYEVASDR